MVNRYVIDGYDLFEAFKTIVKNAEGLDIIPKVKEREEHNWAEESGVEIDTSTELVFEAQDITLNCVAFDSTYRDAIKRVNGIINLLSGSGYHLLGSILRAKLYPVVLKDISSYKLVNSAKSNEVGVSFTLLLRMPLPECRMGSATVLANGEVSLDAETDMSVIVWWGDGSSSTGTGVLEHTYTNAGTYTVMYAGTGVTSTAPTVSGITIDEYSYPASGDITHVTVSPTSGEAYDLAYNHAHSAHAPSNAVSLQTVKEDSEIADTISKKHSHSVSDTPEVADELITNLRSDSNANGQIPDAQATWLGATAKSVLNYIVKIVAYLYSIKDVIIFVTPRTGQTLVNGVILLDRTFTQYNSFTVNGALDLKVGANPALGGYADGVLVMNGVNTPTYSGFNLWPTSQTLDITNGNIYKYFAIRFGTGYYINFTKMN